MSNNQLTIETSSLNQQEFNLLSNKQKIERALDITRSLVSSSQIQQDQDISISDDLQSFTLQNIDVSPFPTESRKIMKFIQTDLLTKFLDKNNFIEVNNYSVIFVSIDDLSYHNFENILNLDEHFNDVQFQLKNQRLIEKQVQKFLIQGSTDTLLSLDKLNYYTVPLNASQRGGKRLIFHSNQLSFSLTKMINESEFFDKKNFRQVNTVFRLNNFAPGDKKFKSHYDTPYADQSNGLYSKYTMLIYLTGNSKNKNKQPPLKIKNIVFDQIQENTCIIFDQQFEHEGNAYFDNNKIFIRTELIYKMDGLGYDENVAKMFNMACYMTKEIDQQQYSANLFNQCVKMRYNIQDVKEDIKRVYLLKMNLEILYATDGNYYWFPSHIPLEQIGALVVLDYFNGKLYGIKNVNLQSKQIKNIDYSKSQQEIDIFIFNLINSCSFEDQTITKDKTDQFQCLQDFIPDDLCEDFIYFRCGCGMGDNKSAYETFQKQKEIVVQRLKRILDQNSVLIFDNLIKINSDNIKIEINSDKYQKSVSQGRIIFDNLQLKVQNQINFASCNCDNDDSNDLLEDYTYLFKTKTFNTFVLPNIQFQKTQQGIKLSIDIFKNGFIYQSTKAFQQPYTNEDESYSLQRRANVESNQYWECQKYIEKFYQNNKYDDDSLHYESEEEYMHLNNDQESQSNNSSDSSDSEEENNEHNDSSDSEEENNEHNDSSDSNEEKGVNSFDQEQDQLEDSYDSDQGIQKTESEDILNEAASNQKQTESPNLILIKLKFVQKFTNSTSKKRIAKIMNQSSKNSLVKQLQQFYINDFYDLIKERKRDATFSLLYFSNYQLMLIQLLIDDTTFSKISPQEQSFSNLLRAILYLKSYLNGSYIQERLQWVFYLILAMNSFILLYFIICAFLKSRTKRQYSFCNFSQLLQCYEYLIAIPSFYISMSTNQYYLPFINILFTLIIGSLIIFVDYDYSFENEDFLQKNDTVLNLISFYLDFMLSISSYFCGIYTLATISFIINTLKLLIIFKSHVYLNKQICRWSIILTFFRICLSFCLVGSQYQRGINFIFILPAILFPICYKIGSNFFIEWYTLINLGCVEKKFNQQHRDASQKMQSNQEFSTNQEQGPENNIDNNDDDQSYLETVKFVTDIYEDAIKHKKSKGILNQIDFSYLSFLSQINKNRYVALFKILNTKMNQNLILGIKDKQKLQNVINLAQKQFKNRSMKNQKENQLQDLLYFDDEIDNIKLIYYECLGLFKQIIQNLMMSYIELNQLLEQLNKYINLRKKLEKKIIQQLKLNPNNQVFKTICQMSDLVLAHKQNFLNFFQKQNQYSAQKQPIQEWIDSPSCYLFVSLLDNSYGTIKTVNKTFLQALGFSNKQQIQGQSIFQLFYSTMQQVNKQQLINNKILSSISNHIQTLPLFLAKHQIGYCVPFQLKAQISFLEQDFGLIFCAKQIKEEFIYLMLDYENPNIIQMASILFYKQILQQKNYKISEIDTIETDKLIPIIHYLIKQAIADKNQTFQTVLIKPNQYFKNQTSLLSDPELLSKLLHTEIFGVTISISFQTKFNMFQQSVYLTIEKINPIKSLQDKIFLLQTYKQQIKEYTGTSHELNLEQEFSDQFEISLKNYIQNEQDDLSLQNKSKLKVLSIQNDKSTNISTNQNQFNRLNELGFSPQNQPRKLINNVNFAIPNTFRNSLECIHISPVGNSLQQISYSMHESVDNIQKSYIEQQVKYKPQQDLSQRNVILESPTNISNKLIKFDSKVNQTDQFNYDNQKSPLQINEENCINLQNYNLDQQQSLKNIDFPLFSSKRELIQPTLFSIQQIENEINKTQNSQNLKKVNFQVEEKENKQLNNLEKQSLSSSYKSSSSSQVSETIHQRKQMQYLKFINILGIASILLMLSLTLMGFLTFYNNLISQRENFKYINWIYMINVQISYSFSERNILLLNKYNFLSAPASQYQPLMDIFYEQNTSRIKLSKDYMKQLYLNSNSHIEVFNIIQNEQIEQSIFQSKTISQKKHMSMLYSILLQIEGLYYFVSDQDPYGISKKQNELNYPALNQKVQSIFSQMNDQYQSELNDIQNQSLIQLYIITLQQILKLFATFDRQQLKVIFGQLTNQLHNQYIEQRLNFNHLSFNITNNLSIIQATEEKKLSISKTSSLKYSLKKLIIGLIVIYCLSIIYPISNYFIVSQFVENSRAIYSFNNAVCIYYFTLLNSLRARLGLATAFMVPDQQALSIQFYQDLIQELKYEINDLPNLIKQNIDTISKSNIYNKEIFNDFLINVLTKNACKTIQKYSQYQNGDFLIDQCNTVGKGSLQSGLLNGLIYFLSFFQDFYSFSFSPDVATFQKGLNKYYTNVPALKQFQFKIELSKEFEYILNFFQEQNMMLYNHHEKLTILKNEITMQGESETGILLFLKKKTSCLILSCNYQTKKPDIQKIEKWIELIEKIRNVSTKLENTSQKLESKIQELERQNLLSISQTEDNIERKTQENILNTTNSLTNKTIDMSKIFYKKSDEIQQQQNDLFKSEYMKFQPEKFLSNKNKSSQLDFKEWEEGLKRKLDNDYREVNYKRKTYFRKVLQFFHLKENINIDWEPPLTYLNGKAIKEIDSNERLPLIIITHLVQTDQGQHIVLFDPSRWSFLNKENKVTIQKWKSIQLRGLIKEELIIFGQNDSTRRKIYTILNLIPSTIEHAPAIVSNFYGNFTISEADRRVIMKFMRHVKNKNIEEEIKEDLLISKYQPKKLKLNKDFGQLIQLELFNKSDQPVKIECNNYEDIIIRWIAKTSFEENNYKRYESIIQFATTSKEMLTLKVIELEYY
ncbi:hypothetical protein ABPG74_019265 [Tetrahymena malaccensis]